MTDITILNKNINKTHEWLNDIEQNAGLHEEDKKRVLSFLRAVLHCLRDHLPINNLAHFSAQLPIVIRGLLFEGWNPEHIPMTARKEGQFLEYIIKQLPINYQNMDIENYTKAVFKTIYKMVDLQEVEKLAKVLPKDIRRLLLQLDEEEYWI